MHPQPQKSASPSDRKTLPTTIRASFAEETPPLPWFIMADTSKTFHSFTCFFFGGCLFLGTEPMSANHPKPWSKHQPRHWTCERSLVHHIYSFDGVLVGPARNNPCPGKSCSRCRRNIVPEKKAKRPRSHGVWCIDFVKKAIKH